MENRYAGDVGDFVKLGLLRHLAAPREDGGVGLTMGLNWYLAPDEHYNADGKHIAYLDPANRQHPRLAACDPDLIERLAAVIKSGRSVEALNRSGALPPGSSTYSEMIVPSNVPTWRQAWHRGALDALAGADVVFADPDNGICSAARTSKLHKYALIAELADYADRGQSLVVYQHANRSEKAAAQAIRRLDELAAGVRQEAVATVIARRGSCRFFLITAAEEHRDRLDAALRRFAARWASHTELVSPDGQLYGSRSHRPRSSRARSPDFARAASDYARHRAGFPDELLDRLAARGIARAGARVADLGTGTGSLARLFAKRGCLVTGVDIAGALLAQARLLDREAGVEIEYVEAPAETTGLPDGAFDVLSAGQCWHWFDRPAAASEVRRLLAVDGTVVIAHFDWLAHSGNVVEATQEIMLRYTPPGDPSHGPWRFAHGTGVYPQWLTDLQEAGFTEIETFSFDVQVPYTHEAWVGRIRASGPIAGTLDDAGVQACSRELTTLLRKRFPEDPLTVPHRCWAVTARAPASSSTVTSRA